MAAAILVDEIQRNLEAVECKSGSKFGIDNQRNGCESIIHDHDIDLCVAMVGWVDVPDSE